MKPAVPENKLQLIVKKSLPKKIVPAPTVPKKFNCAIEWAHPPWIYATTGEANTL
jgi:hypothetical protein